MQGGVKTRRIRAPNLQGAGDSSILKYSTLGISVATIGASGQSAYRRGYIPGDAELLVNAVGPEIARRYSTAKFLPGTRLTWEPSVSFTTSGRVFVGFTDNPEVAAEIATTYNAFTGGVGSYAAFADRVKALSSVVSFPVWQETSINFPNRMRRKRFDTNGGVSHTDINQLDRSMQTFMFAAFEGVNSGTSLTLGGFHHHDVLDVEGMHGIVT